MFNSCYAKARSLLAEEAAQKPAADLWGQHKQMIKLAQDNGMTLAANWAVNMSGRTFSERPTAPADRGLREALQRVIDEHELTSNTKAQQILAGICQALDDNPATPTESIAEEPLAVLADRKGFYSIEILPPTNDVEDWDISLCTELSDNEGSQREKWFDAPTYSAAEAKARKWLNALPNLQEKK